MTNPGSGHSTQISGLSAHILDFRALFERLRDGHTLVTGNSRLTRVLKGQYNQWRLDQGDRQWRSPEIIPWNLWLDKLWEAAGLQGVTGTEYAVPGSRQLINLWETTLKNEPLKHNLLHPEALAQQLLETRRLAVTWQLNFRDPAWFADENENCTAFYHWNKAFEKRCEKDGWIIPEDRIAILIDALKNTQFSLSGSIDLLGFDEFNPAQAGLVSALIESGLPVSRLAMTSQKNRAVLWQGQDEKKELQRMARWVRYWYEKEAAPSIAIVVHGLQTRTREVERQLQDILAPGANGDRLQSRPWNISMGTPLARVPMIESAFDLFKLLDDRIDIQDVGRVLRSPWLRGAVTERNSRAILEKRLREKYPRQLKISEVRNRAADIRKYDHRGNELPENEHAPQPWNNPELASVLHTLFRFEKDSKGLRMPSAWAEALDQLLVNLGWPVAEEAGNKASPGDRDEDHGHDWQALQAWREGLRELASLDATTAAIGLKAATRQLKHICQEKIFQPHTPPAPIQVLGLYEASGLRFDHLWVVGLHNDNWPSSARPNPFIPGKLQRSAQTPNSSPQRELEVARTITTRLLETAPDCIFSYPGQIDGEDVLPSPLLTAVADRLDDDPPAWQEDSWLDTVAGADKPRLDELRMPGGLQYPTARGGSTILKHQALCPFRAFASNRLGADGLESPVEGISPMLHGSLVHKVLENFWREIKTQSSLFSLDEEALGAQVRKHVTEVTAQEPGLKLRPAFSGVEADRLYRHVMDYLELEKDRDPFEVVGFETEIMPEIEGQTVRLFIDRVDQLPSGEEIIIDYKTGRVEPGKWFGPRPEDPQLPLYAISAEQTPAGVAFGIIRDDGCEFKGVVRQGGLLPGLPPKENNTTRQLVNAGHNMPETIESWRQVLHGLMSDFLAGEAAIDPKHGLKTCDNSYCELQPLCRIGELDQRQKSRAKVSA